MAARKRKGAKKKADELDPSFRGFLGGSLHGPIEPRPPPLVVDDATGVYVRVPRPLVAAVVAFVESQSRPVVKTLQRAATRNPEAAALLLEALARLLPPR